MCSMGYGSVFNKLLLTRIGLFAAFGIVMAGAVLASAAIAFRLRPRIRSGSPTTPLLERYREALESRFMVIVLVVSILVGLFGGGAALGRSSIYLAWMNAQPFGTKDPKFGLDISFFVFDYPWWRFVLSFLFSVLRAGRHRRRDRALRDGRDPAVRTASRWQHPCPGPPLDRRRAGGAGEGRRLLVRPVRPGDRRRTEVHRAELHRRPRHHQRKDHPGGDRRDLRACCSSPTPCCGAGWCRPSR